MYETKKMERISRRNREGLSLCDFNSILTGQNIEKNGSLNIINKVQTEWSVMIYAKKWKEGPD